MACCLVGTKPLSEPMMAYLLIVPLGTSFSEIWMKVIQYSNSKMHLKMLLVKWCPDLDVLTHLSRDPDVANIGDDHFKSIFLKENIYILREVQFNIPIWYIVSIYLRVYSLHHNVLPTLQSIPLMTNGPLYPITQDSSCHGQHTMPRSPWSFPWPVPHSSVCMNVFVAVAESVRSGSVGVVSGIYYSDHWWLQAYL